MDSFDKTFGQWNEEDQLWELPPYYLSLLNSLVYIGFAAGKFEFDKALPVRLLLEGVPSEHRKGILSASIRNYACVHPRAMRETPCSL